MKLFGINIPTSSMKSVSADDYIDTAIKTISKPTVEEIHHTFFTEVDRLLMEAGIKTSVEIEDKHEFEQGKHLHELGFRSTPLAEQYNTTCAEINEANAENDTKERLIDSIRYFSQKYPLYRFITEDSVKKICKKYGLVYGGVEFYKGEVPTKNLKEILYGVNTVKEEDFCYDFKRYSYGSLSINDDDWYHVRYLGHSEYICHYKGYGDRNSKAEPCGLVIAAPSKDFDLNKMQIKDFELIKNMPTPPDPIVMKRVWHNGQSHFLILSAWGEEAGDPEVTNKLYN